ncbi:hypothetical protein LY78DRAFT_731908, partial [Colletotrichum sublineola]
LPFGGVSGSDYGRFAGEDGLRGLCNIKSICVDRFGWLGVRNPHPAACQVSRSGSGAQLPVHKRAASVGYAQGTGVEYTWRLSVLCQSSVQLDQAREGS